MTEIWLPVPGCPLHEVSSQGRVRSYAKPGLATSIRTNPKILKPGTANKGYHQYRLRRDDGSFYHVRVNNLVLRVFLGPPEEGQEACHNNGDRTDNRLENLRWDTHQGNMNDVVTHGTIPRVYGEAHPLSKITQSTAVQIRRLYSTGNLTYKELGNMHNISKSLVGMIIRGEVY